MGTLGAPLSNPGNSQENSPRNDNDEIYVILNTDNHYDLLDGKKK
jgi:L-ascorbate metabolism protein UlaG (beta-lactamase superfamily)